MIVGLLTVNGHNGKIAMAEKRHQETLNAIHKTHEQSANLQTDAPDLTSLRDIIIKDDVAAMTTILKSTDARLVVIARSKELLELADAYDSKLTAAAIRTLL